MPSSRRRPLHPALLAPLALLAACAPAATAGPAARGTPAPAAAEATALPLKLAPRATTPAITQEDLTTRLYVFADDSMKGRAAGTEGNVKGTDYIARELRRLGLEPAGDNGTYFQTVPLTDAQGKPSPAPARNVVAVLRGSDPALRGEFVALGAHNDHVGTTDDPVDHDSLYAYLRVVRPEGADSPQRPATPAEAARIRAALASARGLRPARVDSVFNGADDDGSGSMAVLEIAEALATAPTPPRRSVLFVWHTAEELGLVGADFFTRNPTVPREAIVAQINIDMIGRGGAATAGNDVALIGARRLSTQLGEAIDRVNARGHNVRFDLRYDANGHPQQFYCRSDHYMYGRFAIPNAFFFTGVHPDYHQLTDEPQYLNYPHMTRLTRLIHDVVVEVGNLDRRPALDGPRPTPDGPCRQ